MANFTINKQQLVADATSLISKHKNMLNLTFFNLPENLHEAIYDCEIGMTMAFRSEKDFAVAHLTTARDLTIEGWQDSYSRAIPEAIAYHQRVCGTTSHSGSCLGCTGTCSVAIESYGADGKLSLTTGEAKILVEILKGQTEIPYDTPYTAETLINAMN